MSLLSYPLKSVSVAAVRALVENGVRESREIEYKREFSLDADRSKREFVCDVSAFANASGGDILYGVEESDGIITSIPGIPKIEEDKERLRIENLLAGGLSPRLARIEFTSVALENGNAVFVVRVAQSFNAPHMVTYNNEFRFFSRNSSGRYLMDVNQIRDAFATTDIVTIRLKQFREDRLRWIEQREVGVRLPTPNLIVVHLLPLNSIRAGSRFDGRSLQKIEAMKLRPFRTTGSIGQVLNLDGLRVQSTMTSGKIVGYTQLFRNGCLEIVDSDMLSFRKHEIPWRYERTVRDELHKLIVALRGLGIDGPIALGLSLLQVRNYAVHNSDPDEYGFHPIENDSLILPEVLLENDASGEDIDTALRQSFDLVWNACGKVGSPNFDSAGKWRVEPGQGA